ncbi:MAG: arabinose isomerase [Eubacterium sp.]|nr:arabinose isomerase [Eubacterium sp.]
MLVNTTPRIGVMGIALAAYFPQFEGLEENLRQQHEEFLKFFPDDCELVCAGMVSSKEGAVEAGELFRAKDVDVVFVQTLTYSVSSNMISAVKDLDVPVVVVNMQKLKKLSCEGSTPIPYWLGEGFACGPVGEMVAMLKRFNKRSDVITGCLEGGDPYVEEQIRQWVKAAAVRRRFRDTNLCQIGRPYPGMMDLYIDETNLYNRLGIYTRMMDWEKMWAIADDMKDDARIEAKAQDILDTFDIEGGATIDDVRELAAYVCAFEDMVVENKFGMISSHYDGFAQGKAGKLDEVLIPAFSMLIKQGTACAVEGDVKVALCMSILKTISGMGQLVELYSLDWDDDIAIIGHSGSGDADISYKKPSMKIVKVFHGKTGGGYLTQFYPHFGDCTFLAMTQDGDGNFKMIAAEGVCEEGPILSLGDTNQRTRFTCGLREFITRWCRTGPTHHFATCSGRQIEVLKKVAMILNIPLEIVTQ